LALGKPDGSDHSALLMRLAYSNPVVAVLLACACEPTPAVPDASADAASDPADAGEIRAHDAGATGEAGAGADADLAQSDASLTEVPRLPVGYAAFRELARLPVVRIGQRAYMTSTYDRSGGNEGADASHFLRQESATFNVALDTLGPGILSFVRTNHWHGSPWHYVVDGQDYLVSETSTQDPNRPAANSTFLPEAAFPAPLAYTWSVTKGADLSWVSIPFTRSFTLAYERTHYGTGYFIYQRFPERAPNLPEALSAWSPSREPPADVLALLARAGQDIWPASAASRESSGALDVVSGKAVEVAALADGPRSVRRLSLSVSREQALALGRAHLRITWDAADEPAVDAPVALFFGAGTLYNRTGREFLVKALLTSVRFAERVELTSYFPMPYLRGARIELVGGTEDIDDVRFTLRTEPSSQEAGLLGVFHATFTDVPRPEPGRDMVLLDTTGVEGGGRDFCGVFVGMAWTFSDAANLWTLEGDPRFFFDDSQTPQAQGTGTEEWGGGGDYWGGDTMTLPLVGHPAGAPSIFEAQNHEDGIESAYRFLISDAMPFGKNARVQLEHGGTNDSNEHYRAVSFWYGMPRPCLVQTDVLHVGDGEDERVHAYSSPSASEVQTLTSRYEWGIDRTLLTEIYPATTDTGRFTTGTSEFTLAIDPQNRGVLLRRKLDYGFADQRAEVSVAEARQGAPFEPAGSWGLAGSNRCVYSNPSQELGPAAQVVQESNRRFRDDEFLLPPDLTRGRSKIRVRITFVPSAKPLIAGGDTPPTAWSEYRYTAYSYVLPTHE
jgi:hypothetical protein